MKTLTHEFIRLVKKSGWSQREVARQLGVTEGAVSHILTGRNKPSRTAVKFLKLLIER